jgi:hypothetical protein
VPGEGVGRATHAVTLDRSRLDPFAKLYPFAELDPFEKKWSTT